MPPVRYLESSEARYTAVGEMSSVWPIRPRVKWIRSTCGTRFPRRKSAGDDAFGFNRARVDGVDANLARAELLGENRSDDIHGRFRRGVDRSVRWSDGADTGTEVDDAAAFGPHQLGRFLRGQEKAENIKVEVPVEVFFGDAVERGELIDPGIVDQDVELAVGLFGLSEEASDFGGLWRCRHRFLWRRR